MSDSNLNIGIAGDGFMPPAFFGKALRACLAKHSFALRSMQLDGPLRLVSTKKESCLPIAECVRRPEDDFDIVAGLDILITHLAPVTGQTMTRAPRLRLIAAHHLVSRHGSDVVGCAQPSERSARRIAQPIPSVLASDATPRCASMASADRQMIGDATLGHGSLCDLARTWRARQGRLGAPESEDAPQAAFLQRKYALHLRLLESLVSRHRSDVVGCAQPSERSAQPIPSVLASDARPRCAPMASADRQMTDDATLAPLWPDISALQAEAERLDNLRGDSR
ncbi:hypothetical protein [Verminephrobacter eiseniae]|uniref:hypothetical protein n=1 Tax=Verminephrobacter eiseniae TaxID=364317 RepID=UPI0002F16C7B|nr:hypothetical protein [Verminephrobacter eiseniae]MCW8190806.1 hypothetical protein [Verminephrobacter eiseniae]